eukprot:Nk52_evm1s897 gene=Nk52_evmTU1s897
MYKSTTTHVVAALTKSGEAKQVLDEEWAQFQAEIELEEAKGAQLQAVDEAESRREKEREEERLQRGYEEKVRRLREEVQRGKRKGGGGKISEMGLLGVGGYESEEEEEDQEEVEEDFLTDWRSRKGIK